MAGIIGEAVKVVEKQEQNIHILNGRTMGNGDKTVENVDNYQEFRGKLALHNLSYPQALAAPLHINVVRGTAFLFMYSTPDHLFF
jgi:hypothetical protein